MVATRANGSPRPSSSEVDPRIQELLEAVKNLQEQNANQARQNEEQNLRSQALEARENRLQEQLAALQESRADAVRAPLRAFQPFSAAIAGVPIPPRFREPVIGTHDGTGDPHSHVDAFQTQMMISGGSDAVCCKMFAGTLTDVALKWFKGLPARSITSFEDLATKFIQQFSANKKRIIHPEDLFDLHQEAGESLKRYLERFNKVTVQVEDPDEKFFIKAFMKGLRNGTFSEALSVSAPRSMNEIRVRADKHIEAEETAAAKDAREAGGPGETTHQSGMNKEPSLPSTRSGATEAVDLEAGSLGPSQRRSSPPSV